MSLTTELREKLAIANLTMERFREVATRWLSYGILVRDEDRTGPGVDGPTHAQVTHRRLAIVAGRAGELSDWMLQRDCLVRPRVDERRLIYG